MKLLFSLSTSIRVLKYSPLLINIVIISTVLQVNFVDTRLSLIMRSRVLRPFISTKKRLMRLRITSWSIDRSSLMLFIAMRVSFWPFDNSNNINAT